MPKVLSGSRFWVVPIGLIQHQLLKRRQLMDKGTSNSSVATAVSKTNQTTTRRKRVWSFSRRTSISIGRQNAFERSTRGWRKLIHKARLVVFPKRTS